MSCECRYSQRRDPGASRLARMAGRGPLVRCMRLDTAPAAGDADQVAADFAWGARADSQTSWLRSSASKQQPLRVANHQARTGARSRPLRRGRRSCGGARCALGQPRLGVASRCDFSRRERLPHACEPRGIVVAWTSRRRRLTRLGAVSSLDLERGLTLGGSGSPESWLGSPSAGSWSSATLSGAATRRSWSAADAPTAAPPSSSSRLTRS
jgi:hypothetical protein